MINVRHIFKEQISNNYLLKNLNVKFAYLIICNYIFCNYLINKILLEKIKCLKHETKKIQSQVIWVTSHQTNKKKETTQIKYPNRTSPGTLDISHLLKPRIYMEKPMEESHRIV